MPVTHSASDAPRNEGPLPVLHGVGRHWARVSLALNDEGVGSGEDSRRRFAVSRPRPCRIPSGRQSGRGPLPGPLSGDLTFGVGEKEDPTRCLVVRVGRDPFPLPSRPSVHVATPGDSTDDD